MKNLDKEKPLIRQMNMLKLLPRGVRFSSRQVMERLIDAGYEVSLRTVQRDLKEIVESGVFPLEADTRSKPHGWFWRKDAVVDIPSMTSHQALALVMVSRYLQDALPPALLEHLNPLLQKAEQVMDKQPNQAYKHWSDSIAILPRVQRLMPATVDTDIHQELTRALLKSRRVEADYQPLGREVRAYVLNPLGLVLRGSSTYLVASANEYDDPIQFALHRFKNVEVSDKPARIPPGFTLKGYLQTGAFDYPVNDADIQLVALLDTSFAIHLHETPLSADQTLEPMPDGREKLTASVKDTLELRRWLLGFGDEVEVVAPEELREEFVQIAQDMLRRYQA